MYEGLETDWDKMQTKWNVVKGISETFPGVYNLTKRKLYQKILDDLKNGVVPDINPDLYEAYSQNFRKAVAGVFGDNPSDLSIQFDANVSRFAAYKAYHATRELADLEAGEIDTKGKAVLNKYNRWQAAEYNTAVARARTARQWEDLQEDTTLYPNLRWLPSRSATPREQHMVFWNRVWAKDDPFWNENTPGSLWNCKCDWEETDEPVTDGNPVTKVTAKGLEGNPAKTGEIFTDECPYIKNSGQSRKQKEEVEKNCERVAQNLTSSVNKQVMAGKSTTCSINGTEYDVLFEPIGLEHYIQDCFGNKKLFWIKNEILPIIGEYIQKAKCTAKKRSDVSHNTNRKTLRLKRQTSYFYYFPVTLPNQQSAVLHLGMYNSNKIGKEGKMYLYSITKNMPNNIETP